MPYHVRTNYNTPPQQKITNPKQELSQEQLNQTGKNQKYLFLAILVLLLAFGIYYLKKK